MGFTATGFASAGPKTIVNITAFKVMMFAMAQRARSKTDLHELTGLTNTTISRWMTVLSKGKDRIVYIDRWERKGTRGCYTAMWKMGHGIPDAVKPKPLTQSEYAKRWRAKIAKKPSVTQTSIGVIHVAR